MTEYAERLDAIKTRFGLRNTDLAKIGGISDNAISKIMNGLTEAPDVRLLAKVARKFNISGNWLLLGEGSMLKDDPITDDSLKKGLQIRDELITQLQKELWGKSEDTPFEGLVTIKFKAKKRMPLAPHLFLPQPNVAGVCHP